MHNEVSHNGRLLGLVGYRAMLEKDFTEIPDLEFKTALMACQPPHIAVRLEFNCSPKALFLGLHVNGKRLKFAENVFYEISEHKISKVWSVIDKSAIEAQL